MRTLECTHAHHIGWQSLSLGVTNTGVATRGDKEIAIELHSFGPLGVHCTNNSLTRVAPTPCTHGPPNIMEQCAKAGNCGVVVPHHVVHYIVDATNKHILR